MGMRRGLDRKEEERARAPERDFVSLALENVRHLVVKQTNKRGTRESSQGLGCPRLLHLHLPAFPGFLFMFFSCSERRT